MTDVARRFVGWALAALCLLVVGSPQAWAAPPVASGSASAKPASSAAPSGSAAPAEKPSEPARPAEPTKLAGAPKVGLPEGVSMPLSVHVAVFVSQLGKINEAAGTFDGTLDLHLKWRDPRLAFDAISAGSDRQEYGPDVAASKLAAIWNPGVALTNVASAKIEPGLMIFADGTVLYIQRIKATFENKLKLGAFPFDTQTLAIRLGSPRYSLNQVALVQDQEDVNTSGCREGIAVAGWTLKRLEFQASRVRAWNGDYTPEMEARVVISRLPSSHLFAILTPFFLVLLIPSVFTLYAKADVAPRLTAWAGSILALVALNFTFSVRYSALDGDSFVSQLVTVGFAYQMSMVALTATIFNGPVAEKIADKDTIADAIGVARWVVPVGLFGVVITRALLIAFS